jgi:hypothetical protein
VGRATRELPPVSALPEAGEVARSLEEQAPKERPPVAEVVGATALQARPLQERGKWLPACGPAEGAAEDPLRVLVVEAWGKALRARSLAERMVEAVRAAVPFR